MTGIRILALTAGLALLAAAAWLFQPGGEIVEVAILAGQTAGQTAVQLQGKGVVRDALWFRVGARVTGLERRIRPGTYRLRRHMLPWRLYAALSSGGAGFKVAVPEGFSARQIAERLESAGICRAEDFLRHVAAQRLEGYLF
ncbi:MAG: endolytic transglycosylase MltG, partial [Elusimicrobiota bacterium]